jgi:hypothetical protein
MHSDLPAYMTYFPTGQLVHAPDPYVEIFPDGQSMHIFISVDPAGDDFPW